jgi:hypothetical protein
MSDLPTRLRAGVDPSVREYEFAPRGISEEAAIEIERLRAAMRTVIDNVRTGSYESTGQAIDDAEKLLPECNQG